MFLSTLFSAYTPVSTAFSSISRPLKSILGICKTCTSPVLLGNICGFITGPKLICENPSIDYDTNDFTKAVILSSNAGVGFVISFVGIIIWDNIFFGIYLYITQLISSIIISKLMFINHKSVINEYTTPQKNKGFFSSFAFSLTSCTKALILISSYTILFSIFISLFNKALGFCKVLSLFTSSFLEISQGITNSLKASNVHVSAFLTGFSVGFSGLCVIFQIFSICDGYKLIKSKYFFSKVLQGLTTGILATIYSFVFPLTVVNSASLELIDFSLKSIFIITILIFTVIFIIKNKIIEILC